MSVGNLRDQGNKGNNFPFQLGTLQLLDEIKQAIIMTSPGQEYEARTTTYQATANGAGYSIGDIIVRYDIISVPAGVVATTIWFNQTLQTIIAAPPAGDLTPVAGTSSVTIINGPAGAAVNIQDGGNSITIDAVSLPLPTGAATEATLGTVNTAVTSLNTPVSKIPLLFRQTGPGILAGGYRSVSFFNAGNANANLLTSIIKPGEILSWSADGIRDTLGAFSYDASGTELVITIVA